MIRSAEAVKQCLLASRMMNDFQTVTRISRLFGTLIATNNTTWWKIRQVPGGISANGVTGCKKRVIWCVKQRHGRQVWWTFRPLVPAVWLPLVPRPSSFFLLTACFCRSCCKEKQSRRLRCKLYVTAFRWWLWLQKPPCDIRAALLCWVTQKEETSD